MGNRERPVDRGTRLGRASLGRIGHELREARLDRGLSLDDVADAIGISAGEASRIERALSPKVPYLTLARYAAVLGLDLVSRTYAGPAPLRDQAHAALLDDLEAELHASLRFPREVPFPNPGDQRAWDGLIIGPGWRFGVEAETAPHDAQALARRLAIKQRDGEVDGVLLVVRETRRVREFVVAARGALESLFPVPPRRAMASLRAGARPEGNALVVLHHRRRPTTGTASPGTASPGTPKAQTPPARTTRSGTTRSETTAPDRLRPKPLRPT